MPRAPPHQLSLPASVLFVFTGATRNPKLPFAIAVSTSPVARNCLKGMSCRTDVYECHQIKVNLKHGTTLWNHPANTCILRAVSPPSRMVPGLKGGRKWREGENGGGGGEGKISRRLKTLVRLFTLRGRLRRPSINLYMAGR